MTEFTLITGFLGAGKTTALKEIIRQFAGKKLHVIVNEFGKEGVDGRLIEELSVYVDEINNGSIFCSCRLDKFEQVLDGAVAKNPEVILVEASGLSDPTNIRKILAKREQDAQIKFMGTICIADAKNLRKVLPTARVCKKQLAVSDLVLLNKTDLVSPEELENARSMIQEVCPDASIYETQFCKIDPQWIVRMDSRRRENAPRFQTKDIGLQKSLITLREDMTYYQLERFVAMFLEDTYRVKGFVRLEGKTRLVDCVGAMYKISDFPDGAPHVNQLVALAAEGVPMKKSIKKAAEWYDEYIESIE